MKLFINKRVSLSIVLLVAICCTFINPTLAKANTISNSNEIFNEISINELEIGVPVITYQNLDTGEKVEIELIKAENVDIPITTKVYGDSGWTGGTLPPYTNLTLMVRAETVSGGILTNMEYKVDVNGLTNTIVAAYGLRYHLVLWTMNSTSLNVTNPTPSSSSYARAELNFNAVLIEYGIVVGSYGGYLNFEINSNGHCRTSWFV